MTESLLEYHSRLEDLISRVDYGGISREDLDAMFNRLDLNIRHYQRKLSDIGRAIDKLEPAHSNAWRSEN
jgi:hypothetical protein